MLNTYSKRLDKTVSICDPFQVEERRFALVDLISDRSLKFCAGALYLFTSGTHKMKLIYLAPILEQNLKNKKSGKGLLTYLTCNPKVVLSQVIEHSEKLCKKAINNCICKKIQK